MRERMYSPSPTVHSSPVPFYLRGIGPSEINPGLGQDPMLDSTIADSSSWNWDPTGTIAWNSDTGQTLDLNTGTLVDQQGNLLADSSGVITVEQAANALPTLYDSSGHIIDPSQVKSGTTYYSASGTPLTVQPQSGPSAGGSASAVSAGASLLKAATGSASGYGITTPIPAYRPSPTVRTPLPGTTSGSFLNQPSVFGVPNAVVIGVILLAAATLGGRK